jgi:hypothetical protein
MTALRAEAGAMLLTGTGKALQNQPKAVRNRGPPMARM